MKKLFLFLISVCMLCSSISMSAMAEDSNMDVIIEDVFSEVLNVNGEDAISEEVVIDETTTEEVASKENTTEVVAEETVIEEILTEEDVIEALSFENIPEEELPSDCITANERDFTPSGSPRHIPEISLFKVRYSDDQKASILRNFLVERLSNIEQYQDELTLGEYRFPDDSNTSDLLFVNLLDFTDFELLASSSNMDSTKEIISTAINEIQNKFPKLFWVKNTYYWEYRVSDYKVTKIGLKLNCDTDFDVNDGLQPVIDIVNSLTAEFDNYVASIVELIPDDYSDYEKILFVNDYLCTNYRYDVNYSIHNAYDFFKEGTGVCQGYTLAFMAIMDELGIKCDSVVSEEMKHIWNLVELNEKWYHIDVTWNDPYWENYDIDTLGLAQHKYFLLSSERMQDSAHNHTGFNLECFDYEIGTDFDEIDVNLTQSLRSPFIKLNDYWYNTGYNTAARTCGLYSFDSPDISSITNEDLKTPLYKIGVWRTSTNGYYANSFSYLSKYKDTILFNTPTSICVFNGNEVAELYIPEKENNELIYGFTVKENTIYIQLAPNPDEDGMRNSIVKTADIVDVVYMDYDGAILAEGFTVEGTEPPNIFLPESPIREDDSLYEYNFEEWITEDGCTYIAQYTKSQKPVECNVTFKNDKAPSVETVLTIKSGESLILPTPTADGYKFLGWLDAGADLLEGGISYEIEHDIDLTAKWVKEIKINFIENDITTVDGKEIVALAGDIVELYTPTKENYSFTGWEYGEILVTNGSYTITEDTTEDITFTAVWSDAPEIQFTFDDADVTYDGTVQKLLATNVPTGVDILYENNDNCDRGIYIVTATATKEGFKETQKTATLTINPKKISVVGLKAENKSYDGTTHATISGGVLSGVLNGDVVNANIPTVGVFAQKNANDNITVNYQNIELSGADKDNYELESQPVLSANIDKAPLTVTAIDKIVKVGSEIPLFTTSDYKITDGKLYGEDSFKGALATDCNSTSVVNDFNITQGTLSAGDNYEVNFVGGLLRVVDKAEQTGILVSSFPTDIEYGNPGFKIEVTTTAETPDIGSFCFTIVDKDGKTVNISTVAMVDAEGNVTIMAAGTTYIKVSRPGNDNYTSFEQIETLVVAPKEILITPTSGLYKYEGKDDKTITYKYAANQIVNKEKDIISGSLSREPGEKPGKYNITLGTLKINDNYKLVLPESAVTFRIKTKNSEGGAGGSGGSSGGSFGGSFGGGAAKPSTPVTQVTTTEKIEAYKTEEPSKETITIKWNNPFVDVDTEAWYYADVKNIIANNLMTGTANDTFSPNAATTRGMIVTILYRLEGEPATDGSNVFNDVNSSDYYGKAVAWAITNNIVNGLETDKFAPNDEITREQFAAILYRYASFKNHDVTLKNELTNFSDNKEISTWATEAIAWANANGIITGTSPSTISPQTGASRSQVAAMFNRFINLNNK